MLPPLLPSPLSFPSFNGMPCIWRAGAAQASVSMPSAATQGCAETIVGGRTAALPGADDGGIDPHASGRFRGLYEHVKGRSSKRQEQVSREKCNVSEAAGDRSERGKVKAPVNQFNMPVTRPLPRHTDTASPLLDQLHADESDSSVVAQRWKRLQPVLNTFLMSCAVFTKPEEMTDYLAVVQIAVLYLDAPCEHGTTWQAEAVIANVIVLLGKWIQTGSRKVEADSEQERIANRERCRSAIRTSLFGLNRDRQRVGSALSARFIQLIVRVYGGQFTHEWLSSIYEDPLMSARNKLGLTIESKRAQSFLAECQYKELGCRELVQAYLDKGAQSRLVSRIRDDLDSEASTPIPAAPPMA
jgi:hypothetical protein